MQGPYFEDQNDALHRSVRRKGLALHGNGNAGVGGAKKGHGSAVLGGAKKGNGYETKGDVRQSKGIAWQ